MGASSTVARTPVRADRRRNRDRLLDAAAAVLARGVEPTLVHIAQAAGLSRATAYRHFADVDAVRAALVVDAERVGRQFLRARLPALFDGENVHAPIAEQMITLLGESLRLRHRWALAISSDGPQDARLIRTFAPIARGMIRRGQLSGEFRDDIDPRLTGEALTALSVYAARRVHADRLAVDDAVALVRPLLDGLAAAAQPLSTRAADLDGP